MQVLRQQTPLTGFGHGQRGRERAHFVAALVRLCQVFARQVGGLGGEPALRDVGVGQDDAADVVFFIAVGQRPAHVAAPAGGLKLFQRHGLVGQHGLGRFNHARAALGHGKVANRPPEVGRQKLEQGVRRRREPLDVQRAVQANGGNLAAVEQVVEVGVDFFQLAHLEFQLLVDRGEFFVERLQLFLGTLQFFVERTQFLVGGDHLFVGHLEVFGGRLKALNAGLQVVACGLQFFFQVAHQRTFGTLVRRQQRGL